MKLIKCDFCNETNETHEFREYYNARTDPGAKILLEFKPAGDMCQNCAEAVCEAIVAALAARRKGAQDNG